MTWDYVSAFLDTDGSVCLARNTKQSEPTMQVAFHNSYIELINALKEFIQKETGFIGSVSTKRKKKLNHLDSYDLKYTGVRRVYDLSKKLKLLHPVKSKKIKLAKLLVQVTPRNGKYTKEQLQKRAELIQQFHSYNLNFH